MTTRYQVFVSSTFTDLKQERLAVFEAVLKLRCIPAGMEFFGAFDAEQLEVIKRVIDECDYYLLIVGGRYGTLTAEGISFTEHEYEYAVSKGIKVIALLHKDPGQITLARSEADPAARGKLDAFRERVSTGRLVDYWTTVDELKSNAAIALANAIREYPAVGWTRGHEVVELQKQIESLEKVAAEPRALSQSESSVERAELVVELRHDKRVSTKTRDLHCYELVATIKNCGPNMVMFYRVRVEMPARVAGWPGPASTAGSGSSHFLSHDNRNFPLYGGEVQTLGDISGWRYHMTHEIYHDFQEHGWPTVTIQIDQAKGPPAIQEQSFKDEAFQNF